MLPASHVQRWIFKLKLSTTTTLALITKSLHMWRPHAQGLPLSDWTQLLRGTAVDNVFYGFWVRPTLCGRCAGARAGWTSS